MAIDMAEGGINKYIVADRAGVRTIIREAAVT
jgi:hypothetical protein